MRISVQYAVWSLAAMLLVQGCAHKTQVAQAPPLAPPIVDQPLPKPATVSTADLPPPVLGDGKPAPDTKPAQPAPQPVPAQKPAHHNHKPAPQPPAQEAANPPSSVSAVGQLSSGGSGDLRAQTDDLINQTEKGVNGITRPLTDAELKTIAQIREFLKQARQALTTGDLDGAHTLAMKAKVLLAELNP